MKESILVNHNEFTKFLREASWHLKHRLHKAAHTVHITDDTWQSLCKSFEDDGVTIVREDKDYQTGELIGRVGDLKVYTTDLDYNFFETEDCVITLASAYNAVYNIEGKA